MGLRSGRYSLWELPNGLLIEGKVYPIHTDFRRGIAYQAMAAAGTLTEEDFYRLWFPAERPPLEEALAAVGEFYNMGKADGGQPQGAAAYDLFVDAPVIYAGFLQNYGVDLHTAKLHWWQFRALLEGLLTHSFRQRVGYRVGDLGELSREERAEALRYRAMYRLEEPGDSLQEHLQALQNLARKGKEEKP